MATPKIRFPEFTDEWKSKPFGNYLIEKKDKTKVENETTLLSSAINGMFLNSELFGHQRGSSNIGYKKIKKGMLILSAQNLHLGNANVNLRFDEGMVSPAYNTYELVECDKEFMAHWIKREATNTFFYNATTVGASVCRRNVDWKMLYDSPIYLPSIKEQERIASFLANIDKKIELQTRNYEDMKLQKRGILKKLLLQEVRLKKENGTSYPDWELHAIGDIATTFSGGTPKSGKSEYYGGDIPFIRSGEIHTDSTELFLSQAGFDNSSAKMVEVGDLIMALYGATSGEIDISKINGAINQAILCIRPKSTEYDKIYLKILFEYYKNEITSKYLQGGQGNLSAEIIKKLKFNFPTHEEQLAIANCITVFDKKIEAEEKLLEDWKMLKKALLQQMFV